MHEDLAKPLAPPPAELAPAPVLTHQEAIAATAPAAMNAAAGKVFDHWRRTMGKNASAIFSPERRNKVLARLRDGYSVASLCKAIDGNRASPHHRGENEHRTVYDDLELICRDAKHVDQFIGFAEKAAGLPKSAPFNPKVDLNAHAQAGRVKI